MAQRSPVETTRERLGAIPSRIGVNPLAPLVAALLSAQCGDIGLGSAVPEVEAARVAGIVAPLDAEIAPVAPAPPLDEPAQQDAVPQQAAPQDAVLEEPTLDDPAAEDVAPDAHSESVLELDPERVLVATSWQTFVYERPDFSSPRLGYLRSGTVVARAVEPAGFKSCAEGFYRIEPRGYVCVGRAASLDPATPLAGINRHPDRHGPLPYRYAEAGKVSPDFYTRLPADGEAVRFDRAAWSEQGLARRVPSFLADGLPSLRSNGERMSELQLVAGTAVPRSSFALVDVFEHQGRGWGLSTDLLLLPLDRLVPVEPTRFRGVALAPDAALPLAFVMQRGAVAYRESEGGTLVVDGRLEYREAVLLTGAERRVGKQVFLETRDGRFIGDSERLVRIAPLARAPHWAKPGRPWIDVSILKQTLVAYVGTDPVYATLVSTGKDGLADPAESHATVQGEFLIHTKHVTDAMSSDVEGDVYDHRAVPYVQFFKDGYALHAAYWHDGFGSPRSHGCINLAPEDARWLFEWSDPQVPAGWHGALSLLDGTLISIHP